MEEETIPKKKSGIKRFLKTLALASLIAGGYGLFFSQCDDALVRKLSKKTVFIAGVDFQAYNEKELLGINLVKKGATAIEGEDLNKKEIANWSYPSAYDVALWLEKTYSNAVTFAPYRGDFAKKEKLEDILKKGDEDIADLVRYNKFNYTIVIRIEGDKEEYKHFTDPNIINMLTERVAKNVAQYDNMVVVELEAPKDGDFEAHKKRIELIKSYNPNLRIATSIDRSNGFDEESGKWDPEKSRKYWETSDIIIMEDYFSKPGDLEKSLKDFRNVTKKKLWVRVVVGNRSIKEKNMKSLEQELMEYESMMRIAYDHADGCLANDTNGIWLFSGSAYDDKERQTKTKQLYKEFRKVKFIQTRTYGYY